MQQLVSHRGQPEMAPVDKQAELQKALGRPRCGYINRQSLELEASDPNFAPAVPFVTALTGVVAAAETMKWLMGHRYPRSLYFQKSFESGRSKALEMKCESNCECQSLAGTNDRFPVVVPRRLERMRSGL